MPINDQRVKIIFMKEKEDPVQGNKPGEIPAENNVEQVGRDKDGKAPVSTTVTGSTKNTAETGGTINESALKADPDPDTLGDA
jgi:hypothetical protein